MIKLIATDMDGTLLDGNGKLPNNFIKILDELAQKDVKFVVASGRPYSSLKEIFKPRDKELHYICDNGAFIVENNTVCNVDIIDRDIVKEIVKASEKIENSLMILCGINGIYQLPCSDKNIIEEISKYYLKRVVVEDLLKVEDDIFKISICDMNGSLKNSYEVLNPIFGEDLNVVVSGKVWVDIMNKGINKGMALEKIQKDLNISYEETMVFGDFYNDVEMLQKAHYSFVMENANDDMKQYGNFIAKSNHENGVIHAIKGYVLEDIC